MKINWLFVGKLLLVAFLLIMVLGIFHYARAEDSYVEVYEDAFANASTVPIPNETVHIQQGAIVYVGDTIDISGVVPPYPQLAWWDGYDMYEEVPKYNLTLPDNRKGYYKFYLDPAIFSTRLGKWYKYDGTFESNSNNHVFTVAPYFMKNKTMTFPNGTVVNLTDIYRNETISNLLNPTPEILPEKHEADYLVTTEEPFNLTVNQTTAIWLFNGEDNSILYSAGEAQVVFNKTNITNLQPGTYSLIVQTLGNNTLGFDVIYTNHSIRWFNQKTFEITQIDTTIMVPEVAIKTLEEIFPKTRDHYEIKRLSVQRPEVIISQMNEAYSISAKTYYHDSNRRGNISVMDVRGYVNAYPGTNITVTLDAANTYIKDRKFTTFNTTSIGQFDGNWRQWQVNVPFYWDALDAGIHTISAQSSLGGGVAYSDFAINQMPSDSFVPSQTVKWVGDRNPWVPTPTPEVRTVITEVPVVQTITVPVTPTDEQVRAQQKIVSDERWNANVWLAVEVIAGIIILIGLFFLGKYALSVWRRL